MHHMILKKLHFLKNHKANYLKISLQITFGQFLNNNKNLKIKSGNSI